MRTQASLYVLVMSLFLSGCAMVSLHPVATPDNTVTDNRIVGQWVQDDENPLHLTVTIANNKTYHMLLREHDGKTGLFDITLVKLGDELFCQLFPNADYAETSTATRSVFFNYQTLGMYDFLLMRDIADGVIKIAFLDGEKLEAAVTSQQKVSYVLRDPGTDDQRIILTAEPSVLAEFLTDLASRQDLWKTVTFKHVPIAADPNGMIAPSPAVKPAACCTAPVPQTTSEQQ